MLAIEAQQQLVTGALSLDNRLAGSLGAWESNASLAINNALGLGEQAYVSLGTAFPVDQYGVLTSPLDLVGAGFIAPIGADGWTINPEFTHSRTQALTPSGAPQTIGSFDRYRAAQLLCGRSRPNPDAEPRRGARIYPSGELFPAIPKRPRFRPLCGRPCGPELAGRAALAGAPAQFRLQVSQGLGGRNAADAAADGVPLSRLGATPEFFKLNIDAKASQPLFDDVRIDVNARAQDTFRTPVFVSEQFSLDGADAVSTFPSGSFSVDAGAVVRAELTRPFASVGGLGPSTFSPYLFAAQGWGALYEATALEAANVRAGGFGVGLRVGFDATPWVGATAGIEFGRGYSNIPSEPPGYRVNFSLGMHF